MTFARREHAREISEPGAQVDEAEPGDGSAHEVVGEDRLERRPPDGEVVVLPESRPRQDDEQ